MLYAPPVNVGALATTGFAAWGLVIAAFVLIFAGLAVITIARVWKHRRDKNKKNRENQQTVEDKGDDE